MPKRTDETTSPYEPLDSHTPALNSTGLPGDLVEVAAGTIVWLHQRCIIHSTVVQDRSMPDTTMCLLER